MSQTIDTAPEGMSPEAMFAGQIERLSAEAETAIDRAQRELESNHVRDILRFWDSDTKNGYTAHAAMIKVLENHGVLDAYYTADTGQRTDEVTCIEYDDDTVFTRLKSHKKPGYIIVSDTWGEDDKGKKGHGQVLQYRKP